MTKDYDQLPQAQMPLSYAGQTSSGQYDVVPPVNNGYGASGHNPYEFIVNPNTPKKSGMNLFGGNAFFQKIALLVGGVVILMIIAGMVLSALLPSNSSKANLISIAQKQQEMIRISNQATTQATGQPAKNFAITALLGLTTDQQEVLNYLAAHGTKLGKKTLALDQSAQTDTLLANAKATSTFDAAYEQIMTTQLNAYKATLKQTYTQATSNAVKNMVNEDYNACVLLLEQVKTNS